MTPTFAPDYSWQMLLALAVAVLTAVAFVVARRRLREGDAEVALGGSPRTRRAVAVLSAASAMLLSLTLCGAVLAARRPEGGFHLPLLIDVSDSVLRSPGGWPAVRAHIADHLDRAFATRPVSTTSQVVSFRSESAASGGVVPLRSIAGAVRQLESSAFGAGNGTDIGGALRRAAAEIDRTGGPGAILLISDGHETDGDARAAAAELARRGISVHVLPLDGGPPAAGIVSANLPRYVDAGAQTFVRAVLSSGDEQLEAALIRGALRRGNGPRREDEDRVDGSVRLTAGQWGRVRTPIAFEHPGLQFVDLVLSGTGPPRRRRLFTHVERPPRVLALGDDLWSAAFAPDSLLLVAKSPRDVAATDTFADVDAFVIDSVPANVFADGVLSNIAAAITQRGAGLFMMNGRHAGAPNEVSNLATYADTPLDELLPLTTRPRPEENPPRHIVFVIDSSGSMAMGQLDKAKQIAVHIIEKFLRPTDVLDVMTFTTGSATPLQAEAMTAEGRAKAIDEILRIQPAGGTDPSEVLRLLNARALTNCGLLFFSDGDFAQLAVQRPDCRTTVFGIRPEPFGANEPMRALADPIHVDAKFDPRRLSIPYFEPRVEKWYEAGEYRPLSMKYVLPRAGFLEIPNLPLAGSATTFVKPNTELAAVRPKLTDPVLAYKQAGAGSVGEFTTTVPRGWLSQEEGRRAIRQWITAILPLADERRYVFQLAQEGQDLDLELALSPQGGSLPDVEHIDARIVRGTGDSLGLAMRRDDLQPATFRGRVSLSPETDRTAATLVLQESGRDALPGPQRIAILLPPADTGGRPGPELFSHGTNGALLRSLAAAGGGAYQEIERLAPAETTRGSRLRPLWPVLAVLAVFCHLAAIFLRRIDP